MELFYSNKNKIIDLSNIDTYKIEKDYDGSFYFDAILDDGQIIDILTVNTDSISLECGLSEQNILDILNKIEEKEHIFPITRISDKKTTDLALVVLNKLFVCVYLKLDFNYKKLYEFLSSRYDKEEIRILGTFKDMYNITEKFLPDELDGLFQSRQFLGFIKTSQLLFEKDLKKDLPNIYCKLDEVEDNGNVVNFCGFRVEDDMVVEKLIYGTYYKNNNSFFPRITLNNPDEIRALLFYISNAVCSPELIYIYSNIFRSIILASDLKKDKKVIELYNEVFDKQISYDDSIKEEVEQDSLSKFDFIKGSAKTNTSEHKKTNSSNNDNNSALEKYARNLNNYSFSFDPSIGRESELKDVIVSLVQGSSILVGEAGVGKTALVEGLAYKIKNGEVPSFLQDKEIYKITASDIVSGCGIVGDIERRMKSILEDVMKRENVILFFDEIHTAFGTGKGRDGTLDIANILKPYVDRDQIKIVGATTAKEYDEHFDKDPAFKRRFEKVIIKEPTDECLYEIIDGVMSGQEKQFNIYLDESIDRNKLIENMIVLTSKYHRDQLNMEYNPALVLSILKKAFSYAVYYEHSNLEVSDIKEAIDKCVIISQPAKDEFERNKRYLELEKKNVKQKVIQFSKN